MTEQADSLFNATILNKKKELKKNQILIEIHPVDTTTQQCDPKQLINCVNCLFERTNYVHIWAQKSLYIHI